MEEHLPTAKAAPHGEAAAAQPSGATRSRAQELLDAHRKRLEQLETSLTEHLRTLAEEFTEERADTDQQREALDAKAAALKHTGQELSQLQRELHDQRVQWEKVQERAALEQQTLKDRLQEESTQLDARRSELAAAEAKQRESQRELGMQREEHQATVDQFTRRQQRLDELEKRLESEREQVETLQAETKSQRRRIAAEFKAQRAASVAEVEARAREIERTQSKQHTDLDQIIVELHGQVAHLQAELKHASTVAAEAATERDKARAEVDRLRQDTTAATGHADDELQKLRAEKIELKSRLKTAEAATAKAEEDAAKAEAATAKAESIAAKAEKATAKAVQDVATAEANAAKADGDAAKAAQTASEVAAERDKLQAALDHLRQDAAAATTDGLEELQKLRAERDALSTRLITAEASAASATKAVAEATTARDQAQKALEQLRQESATATTDTGEELTQLRQERDALSERLAAAEANAAKASNDELTQLREERDSLVARLAEAELAAAKSAKAADPQRTDDLKRRFELAVEDVRDLKRRNADLEEKLAAAKTSSTPATPDSRSDDWETRKRKLMASLEADDAPRGDDRLTIEGTIRITDDVVSQKDREIAQLRRQLAQQGDEESNEGGESSPANDVATNDEQILAEREKLALLQQEWKEKLRQAEIDISIERAKIARERANIEERMQAFEAEQAERAANPPSASDQAARQPTRGRWLARLGLKDNDENKK